MCLRRAPEKYIAGAALDRAALLGLGLRPLGRPARSQSLYGVHSSISKYLSLTVLSPCGGG
jgi:hypothetical protein